MSYVRSIVGPVDTWAGYIRVSHVGGRSGESFRSPDDQAAAIRKWATEQSARVDVLEPELNRSGGTLNRPILQTALERIEAGKYVGIVVAYQSRLSRDVADLLMLERRVEKAGGKVVFADGGVDTGTPIGAMVRTVRAAIDQMTREEHAVRFEHLREVSVERGIWQRRQVPLGYLRDPETRRLVPSDDAPRIVKAFDDRIAGRPLVAISRDLDMTHAGCSALLQNRVYLGELRVGKHIKIGAHPAIIDADTFDSAQRVRAPRPALKGREPALLAGLIRCAGCSHIMSRSSRSRAVVYGCHINHRIQCPEPAAITVHLIDGHVTEIAIAALQRLKASGSRDTRALDDARKASRAAEVELAAYLDAVSAADVGIDAFRDGATARRKRLDEAKAALAHVVERANMAFDGDPVTAWEMASATQRNRLLRGLVEMVVVKRAGGRGRVVPIESRVRVIAAGAGLAPPVLGGDHAIPVAGIVLPDLDDPRVLRA